MDKSQQIIGIDNRIVFSQDSTMVLVDDRDKGFKFFIDRTEVTFGEYIKYSIAVGKTIPGQPDEELNDNYPVVNITWNDAQGYAKWANKRLPTEEEWESAALNGNSLSENEYSLTSYYTSIDEDDYIWHMQNSDNSVHPVAKKKPNDLQIFDMCGNVYEWCSDSTNNGQRILKGGSYIDLKENCKIKLRKQMRPDFKSTSIGFRCVKDVK